MARTCYKPSTIYEVKNLSAMSPLSLAEKNSPHTVTLCATSEYFKAMFTSGFSKSSKSEITIEGKSTIFERILEFMCTGELHLTDDILPDVIQMASYFQFTHVLTVCERFLTPLCKCPLHMVQFQT